VVAELKSNVKNRSIVRHKEQTKAGRRAWRKFEMPIFLSVNLRERGGCRSTGVVLNL